MGDCVDSRPAPTRSNDPICEEIYRDFLRTGQGEARVVRNGVKMIFRT
jgi:hypothetical protein